MKKTVIVVMVVLCVVSGGGGWLLRGKIDEAKIQRTCKAVGDRLDELKAYGESPDKTVATAFDVIAPGNLQVLVQYTNKTVAARVSVDPSGPRLNGVCIYGGDPSKPVMFANCHTNGLVSHMAVLVDGKHTRDWGFDEEGTFVYQTVYTNNLGERQYYSPEGVVTGHHGVSLHGG